MVCGEADSHRRPTRCGRLPGAFAALFGRQLAGAGDAAQLAAGRLMVSGLAGREIDDPLAELVGVGGSFDHHVGVVDPLWCGEDTTFRRRGLNIRLRMSRAFEPSTHTIDHDSY